MKVPITKPYFGEEEKRAILEPLETGWVVQGPKVAQFEQAFAEYVGSPYALATSSCTTALHLALVALEVGPGDEVILPSFTWVATANVVETQGAKPVFVDVELDTFNVDASQIEAAVTSKTKVIMPVSLFGVSSPITQIMELAGSHNIKVVEDNACGIGAWCGDKHAGTLADIGCFSFHPRKAITTGEGGMLVTSDESIAARVSSLRDHGASKSDLTRHLGARSYLLPDFNVLGYNYRLTDIQAAVGIVQMGRLDWIIQQRTRLAHRYDEALRDIDWLRPQVLPENYRHGYQAYVCLFQPESPTLKNIETLNEQRNALMDSLENAGIATRPGTHAVHMLGFYKEKYSIASEDVQNAYIADRLSLTLPLYPQMTEEEQDYVIEHLSLMEESLL